MVYASPDMKLLILDQNPEVLRQVKQALLRYECIGTHEFLSAQNSLATQEIALILLGQEAHTSTKDMLETLKKTFSRIPVIVLSERSSVGEAVDMIRAGAYNYVGHNAIGEVLEGIVDKAFRAQEMVAHAVFSAPLLRGENEQGILSQSEKMQKIYELIEKVARVNTPVLLRGESGTGKELMSRAIHYNSLRKEGRFVAINCSAIPETLIESELFGHEKGAFTGAVQKKMGKFQYADGGTLFLDEIGDVSLPIQVKLLRALQEQKITPVGSNQEISVDVRIIAATHQNLEDMILQGKIREDFYYRLSVMPIFLPSLRDRTEDIEVLAMHFIEKFNQSHDKNILGLTPMALEKMKQYSWPGNIRELRNVIEHAFVLEQNLHIQEKSLPDRFHEPRGLVQVSSKKIEKMDLVFPRQKEKFEREFLIQALSQFKGKINQTALHTKIPKKTLLRKLEKYGIKAAQFKD